MDGAHSMIERQPPLKDLIDVASFTEVCRSFVDLYGIGIRVFDAEGSRLIDLRVGNTDFCGYVLSFPPGRKKCTATVQRVKNTPLSPAPEAGLKDRIVSHVCFTGLRYLALPLLQDIDPVGTLIAGPFLPDDLPEMPPELRAVDPGFDPEAARTLLHSVRRAPEETLRSVLCHLRNIVEVLIHAGHKAHLTSTLHIESITVAHHELVDKNQRLEQSLEKLRELDRLKSNFLATVSHELRTPLTSVIGYSEMLLEGLAGDLTEEQREYVSTIMSKGEDLLQLIGSILDVSRIESGKIEISPIELDLHEIAAAAVSTIKPLAQKKNLRVSSHLAEQLPQVQADRDKVRQCVVNLLANAVKFTPDGGEIELRVDSYFGPRRRPPPNKRDDPGYSIFEMADAPFVRISVRDSGTGIPDNEKDKIFETFYQVDSSSTRAFGGAGLGLSIVRSYVEAHEGEVWVDSTPGEGSTFSLLLPVQDRQRAAASAAGSC